MTHSCTPPVVIFSGGYYVESGKPAGRTWMVRCRGCLWQKTGDRELVSRLAAEHEGQTLWSAA